MLGIDNRSPSVRSRVRAGDVRDPAGRQSDLRRRPTFVDEQPTTERLRWHSRMAGDGLLATAMASVLVYGLGDLASGLLYPGYSYRDQWISELTAFGSPVRRLMTIAILVHGVLLLAFSLIVFMAVALSGAAYSGWFRYYAIVTIAVLVGFGMASSMAIQGLARDSTPWAGAFERMNAYAYFAWLIVLAATVTRRSLGRGRGHSVGHQE